jgi:hypothetical protein
LLASGSGVNIPINEALNAIFGGAAEKPVVSPGLK